MDEKDMPVFIEIRINQKETIGSLIERMRVYGYDTPIEGVTWDYTTPIISVGPLKEGIPVFIDKPVAAEEIRQLNLQPEFDFPINSPLNKTKEV